MEKMKVRVDVKRSKLHFFRKKLKLKAGMEGRPKDGKKQQERNYIIHRYKYHRMKEGYRNVTYSGPSLLEMSKIQKSKIWSPCKELMAEIKEESYGIVILNTPIINFRPDFLMRLWNQARVRITVDGGTEKWIQWLALHKFDSDKVVLPDLITGDMDSVPKDILEKYQNSSAEIIVTPDQNETDYVKALRELEKYCRRQNKKLDTLYVIADTCGRFDQIMANVNALYKSRDILEKMNLFHLASTSLSWLLDQGSHQISVPLNLRNHKEWCALIPIGFPCNVTTTGLKWNLDNRRIEFGGLVSTSNTYDGSPVVTVKTDHPVIWSMGISTLYDNSETSRYT